MISLTQQQRKLFNYIKHCISTTSVAPSQRDGFASRQRSRQDRSTPCCNEIEARGWIIVHKYKSRTIEIPRRRCPHCGAL